MEYKNAVHYSHSKTALQNGSFLEAPHLLCPLAFQMFCGGHSEMLIEMIHVVLAPEQNFLFIRWQNRIVSSAKGY